MPRHPFIVLEGLDGVGKSTLARRLSQRLAAKLLASPPPLVAPDLGPADLRAHFDRREPAQRRAYYRFANLVLSEQARVHLAEGPVVCDRYWPSTVAFATGLEGVSSPLAAWRGRYPEELLVPDLVVLLTASDEARQARIEGREGQLTAEEGRLDVKATREAILSAYRTFGVAEIDTSDLDPDGVLEVAFGRVTRLV